MVAVVVVKNSGMKITFFKLKIFLSFDHHLYFLYLHRQKAHLQKHERSCRIYGPKKVHELKKQKCEKTDLTTKELEPTTASKDNSLNTNSKNCQQPQNETLIGCNPENMTENYTSAETEDRKFYESKSVINNQKNNHENEPIISEILKRELRVKLIDFSICHCNLDKPISTHYCNECSEGFCSSCSKAHQRFKVTRKHYMQKINYFCKCKNEEKLLAAKFCQECSEFFLYLLH